MEMWCGGRLVRVWGWECWGGGERETKEEGRSGGWGRVSEGGGSAGVAKGANCVFGLRRTDLSPPLTLKLSAHRKLRMNAPEYLQVTHSIFEGKVAGGSKKIKQWKG